MDKFFFSPSFLLLVFLFFWLLPSADHLPHPISSILLCHTNLLNVHLHHFHESCLRSSSFCLAATSWTSFVKSIHHLSSTHVQTISASLCLQNPSCCACFESCRPWSLLVEILTSSALPPPAWPPVYCQSCCLDTIHHSRYHFNLVNLPFHSCLYLSATNHPWHLSPPTPHAQLSVVLDGWPQVFKPAHLYWLYSFHFHCYALSPSHSHNCILFFILLIFIPLLLRKYLHPSRIYSLSYFPSWILLCYYNHYNVEVNVWLFCFWSLPVVCTLWLIPCASAKCFDPQGNEQTYSWRSFLTCCAVIKGVFFVFVPLSLPVSFSLPTFLFHLLHFKDSLAHEIMLKQYTAG